MKNMIETFSALGARLLGFGDDDATRAVIDSACRANGWFTPADIRRAVRAIACDMLQREKLEAWLADYPALPVAEPRRVLVVMAGNIPLVLWRLAGPRLSKPERIGSGALQSFGVVDEPRRRPH